MRGTADVPTDERGEPPLDLVDQDAEVGVKCT